MISELKVRMVGGWEVFSVSMKYLTSLLRVYKLKKTNIVSPTVSQLYIIYEYRIGWIGPTKHA